MIHIFETIQTCINIAYLFLIETFLRTYIDILQLPNVWMDITENTVKISVLLRSLDPAANKAVYVQNQSVTFLRDAILDKMARF